MNQLKTPVSEIVKQNPLAGSVFFKLGIDFCCGGSTALDTACLTAGIEVNEVLTRLSEIQEDKNNESIQPIEVDSLINHILQRYHRVHKEEIPVIKAMLNRVVEAHGEHEPSLHQLKNTVLSIFDDIEPHMLKEERILFPLIIELHDAQIERRKSNNPMAVTGPIVQMEHEHELVGELVWKVKDLTSQFTPPDFACNTYRALFAALRKFTEDLLMHIHLENNLLHPGAISLFNSMENSNETL